MAWQEIAKIIETKEKNKYFDMKNDDIGDITIYKTYDSSTCYISKTDNKMFIYNGFILANGPKRQIICEVSFYKTKGRYIPRLVLKKIDSKTGEIKDAINSKVRISLSKESEGRDQFWKMISFLGKFKEIVDLGNFDSQYSVLSDANLQDLFQQIKQKGSVEELGDFLNQEHTELVSQLHGVTVLKSRNAVLVELRSRLAGGTSYPESKGTDSWQTWVYKNHWLFGANYTKPFDRQKINIDGIMPDFLFPTLDKFIDVLEIKLPKDDVIRVDPKHKGSWILSLEANTALGQVVNYLNEISDMRIQLENKFDDNNKVKKEQVSVLKPRAFILIGNSESWEKNKIEGLRKINHSLHDIEILTYHDLYIRGQATCELFQGLAGHGIKTDDFRQS